MKRVDTLFDPDGVRPHNFVHPEHADLGMTSFQQDQDHSKDPSNHETKQMRQAEVSAGLNSG